VIALVGVFVVLGLSLIGLAIWRRPFVKASLTFWSIGFSLEAKSKEESDQR
jgi:hypothetical protein